MVVLTHDMVVLSIWFRVFWHSKTNNSIATILFLANQVWIAFIPGSATHFNFIYRHIATTGPWQGYTGLIYEGKK